jgi:hypothetical protein
MNTCYDNPETWRREVWNNQMLMQYITEQLISELMVRNPHDWPPESAFCPGRIKGPVDNLPQSPKWIERHRPYLEKTWEYAVLKRGKRVSPELIPANVRDHRCSPEASATTKGNIENGN